MSSSYSRLRPEALPQKKRHLQGNYQLNGSRDEVVEVASDLRNESLTREKNLSKKEVMNGNQKPEWLDSFIKIIFFDACPDHPVDKNEKNRYLNERNRYCVDCNTAACQYCIDSGDHRHHRTLQIYHYIYQGAVPLDTMKKHMDCSQIQPYRSNKKLVLPQTPLPRSGSKNDSANDEGCCEICKRTLREPDRHRYCCISCKESL
ncbi:protein RGF1 INDUCIBLE TRANSCRIPTION FACTOR 1-like [Malus domestica]|uniref:protein RGF1 INDUCIBLE TRANSCRIPTION FACTOR 1-like n=1 Tax=Malus domestica TaxID=3750 RepID=UPI003974E855